MNTAAILSIGTELSLGRTVDTNAAWIAQRLAECGLRANLHLTVPDDQPDVEQALHLAAQRCPLIICTGGLGPTDDDLTRDALAAASDDQLVTDDDALAEIRAYFERRQRPIPDGNELQALRPSRGRSLTNPRGTAPGIYTQIDTKHCFALPGVPAEMKTMFEQSVRPFLIERSNDAPVIRSRIIWTTGMPEAEVSARLGPLMRRGQNPEIGTTASLGVIGVRINVTAPHTDIAQQLDDAETQVRSALDPQIIFGVDDETLPSVTMRALAERGLTLAVAESCTGGLISKLLTDLPGASDVLRGAVIPYQTPLKTQLLDVPSPLIERCDVVSDKVAESLATQARIKLGADIGLGVTGVAGPAGGTPSIPVGRVYVAVDDRGTVTTRELNLGSDASRDNIRQRTARTALNLIRTLTIGSSANPRA